MAGRTKPRRSMFRWIALASLLPAAIFTYFQIATNVDDVDRVDHPAKRQQGSSLSADQLNSMLDHENKIFTMWDYPGGAPVLVKLNIETWQKHAPPDTIIVYVNDSNIRDLVPDIPEEYFRLPYSAAKSDFVRSSVLYHHGGIYMDSDFLVMQPLEPFFRRLKDGMDIIVYTDAAGAISGPCKPGEHFSSNFLAAGKGNPFSKTWWNNMKFKLTRLCGEGEFEVEKICCHEAFAPEPERRQCHIPWGHLEWLKLPQSDPDAKGKPQRDPTLGKKDKNSAKTDAVRRTGPQAEAILAKVVQGNKKATQLPDSMRAYCYRGPDGMTPQLNGEIVWQPWNFEKQETNMQLATNGNFERRFSCEEALDGDLSCAKATGPGGNRKNIVYKKFFDRPAYHLFFSSTVHHVKSRELALSTPWLLAELYKRSLGLEPRIKKPSMPAEENNKEEGEGGPDAEEKAEPNQRKTDKDSGEDEEKVDRSKKENSNGEEAGGEEKDRQTGQQGVDATKTGRKGKGPKWKSLAGLVDDEGHGLGSDNLDLEPCQAKCDSKPGCFSITYAPGWCHLKDKCVEPTDELTSEPGKSIHNGGPHVTWYKSCDDVDEEASPGGKLSPQAQFKVAVSKQLEAKYKIFTFWDYPGGVDPWVEMNVETWLAHSPPGTEVIKVNHSNIKYIVPDCPKEFDRFPYAAAKSDFVRASVLYHHGGLYMDADFIVLGDLGQVWYKLEHGYDMVTYSDGGGQSGECTVGHPTSRNGFSSNFIAGNKHNPFHATWWENMKHKLTRLCGEGEFAAEKVCCHEAFAKKPEKRPCHVPWGHLEWLKQPKYDADLDVLRLDPTQKHDKNKKGGAADRSPEDLRKASDAVAAGNKKAKQLPDETKMFCFRGNEGMAPHLNGEIYWQPWIESARTTNLTVKDASQYDVRFDCLETKDGDLNCKAGNWGRNTRNFPNFFGRIAYHLFFSTRRSQVESKKEIAEKSWLLSAMYRKSLGSKLDGLWPTIRPSERGKALSPGAEMAAILT